MYECFAGLNCKPFSAQPRSQLLLQQQATPAAKAYSGLRRHEGFIVITGEVGAGKTTIVRGPAQQPESQQRWSQATWSAPTWMRKTPCAWWARRCACAARTRFQVRPPDGAGSTSCAHQTRQGKRARIVDEAQNLTPSSGGRAAHAVQLPDRRQVSCCRAFLLGQPEFRATLHNPQHAAVAPARDRHLPPGPDGARRKARPISSTACARWAGSDDPHLTPDAHAAFQRQPGGIPRKTNHLMDRLLLMGFLEEMQEFARRR